jgi:hypothetical protein
VFIGGCATGLLLTDAAAAPARATMDVDAIVEAASYEEFTVLEQRLRHLGFRQPSTEGSPICRWVQDDLILDLMPTDPSILGFGNRWYGPALENSQRVSIGDYRSGSSRRLTFWARRWKRFTGEATATTG